jgi:Na+-translocating ferredoxin:NAD+ oxidoreductase RnfC subunit
MALDLINKIFAAGVVGCGGAGFPTHVKLNAKPEILIINGAECEPLLRTDRYLMIHQADKLVAGIDMICRELAIPDACIALKKSYEKEIQALSEAIKKAGSGVRLHPMDSFYPAGDEQVVVYEVTGKVVPPAGIPLDVGVIVDNVATVIAVADAANDVPFTEKYLTVTGEVREPSVLKVPVGTSFAQCIELAGGLRQDKVMVVSGGPMMGRPMSYEEAMQASVTKTTSGILVLPEDGAIDRRRQTEIRHMLNRARSACIQCTFCTQMCPRHMLGHPLQPHRIMRKMATCTDVTEVLDDTDIRQAAICSECGVCEVYACPMGLQPRVINGMLKGELAKAGIRYQRQSDCYEANENRSYRKVPTKRIAARAGVGDYYHIENHVYKEDTAKMVTLPLKMHIGVPAVPVVQDGDRVAAGQLIAACPEGKMGANLHASISGIARITEQSIIITEV